MGKLDGKIALVTGAAMGNGAGIAKVLTQHGATVVLTDINEDVHETSKRINHEFQGNSVAYIMNVVEAENVQTVVDEVTERFERIDILVNNAGYAKAGNFEELPTKAIDQMIDVNVRGVLNCSRSVIGNMRKNQYGKIVNISSVTGPIVADSGYSVYAATKGAVMGLTKALASEYGPSGINVNAVLPGSIDTPMLRNGSNRSNLDLLEQGVILGRLGTIDEIGDAVAFLASEESKYITGTGIVVDGGATLIENSAVVVNKLQAQKSTN